eukprot:scaffold71307_cov63-Phaeocystis_antarctica.AAC.4
MEAAAIASGPKLLCRKGYFASCICLPNLRSLSVRGAARRLEAACWPTLSSYAARPLRSSAAPPPGASVNVHTDAWALAEPERRERSRDGRVRCPVSQQLHRAAARPKRGGSVPLRALERALVRVRAATHALLSSSGIHQQRHASAEPISTHAPPSAPHPPTHTCVADQPFPPTRAWI